MVADNILTQYPSAKEIHANYKFAGSSFSNLSQKDYANQISGSKYSGIGTAAVVEDYYVPLDAVRSQVQGAEEFIYKTRVGLEDFFLRKLFIKFSIDYDLEKAHERVWKEATLLVENFDNTKYQQPSYICFDQYQFAERYLSSACRRFISEFEEAISQSTFSYFYQMRKILIYLSNEIYFIKSSLLFDFGAAYENASQQKIALQYDAWAKMAVHYTRRIADSILSKPGEIPNAEVDKISKKQAAQFQAFFAIRLNAVDEEINDLLSSIKRDLTENSEIFYKRYLRNSLKLTTDVVSSLNLDYHTTMMRKETPTLAGEVILATNFFQAHFTSIHADFLERTDLTRNKIDAVLSLIHEKRRFANYISQLAEKAVKKVQVLQTVSDDIYGSFFRSIYVNKSRNDSYESMHSRLDGLDEDSHPQYLLKSGGKISGNIDVDDGVKIGGISLRNHSHNGVDGSSKISILDIDYQTVRNDNLSSGEYAKRPLNISIDQFVPDIIDGGIPVFDTIISIEMDDGISEMYEYEIVYTEIT